MRKSFKFAVVAAFLGVMACGDTAKDDFIDPTSVSSLISDDIQSFFSGKSFQGLEQDDLKRIQAAYDKALGNAEPGLRVTWRNPKTEQLGEIQMGRPTDAEGRLCRSAVFTVYFADRRETAMGNVCNAGEGGWSLRRTN